MIGVLVLKGNEDDYVCAKCSCKGCKRPKHKLLQKLW